jgi:hypothetical protein
MATMLTELDWVQTESPGLPALTRHVSAPSRTLDDVWSTLGKLVALEPNWDGYGSPPVALAVAGEAFNWLRSLVEREVPVPAAYPTPEGGVHFEWRQPPFHLDVTFVGVDRPRYFFADGETDEEGYTSDPQFAQRLVLVAPVHR